MEPSTRAFSKLSANTARDESSSLSSDATRDNETHKFFVVDNSNLQLDAKGMPVITDGLKADLKRNWAGLEKAQKGIKLQDTADQYWEVVKRQQAPEWMETTLVQNNEDYLTRITEAINQKQPGRTHLPPQNCQWKRNEQGTPYIRWAKVDKSMCSFDNRMTQYKQLEFFGKANFMKQFMMNDWEQAKKWVCQHPIGSSSTSSSSTTPPGTA